MKSLDQIMVEMQSDKASQFSRTWAKPHDYCRHLELFFAPLRDKPIKLLEIGVGGGESIRAWLEYFDKAHVYGVDIVSGTNEWNTVGGCTSNPLSYTFVQGNQSDSAFWQQFIKTYGGDWDVICDDGSHLSSDIMITFNSLMPHLKSGGIYEIEDLKQAPEAALWLQDLVGAVNAGTSGIDAIFFSKELCVMRKK